MTIVLSLLLLYPGQNSFAWSGGGVTDDLALPRYGTLDWIAEEALKLLPDEESSWIEEQMRDYFLGTEGPESAVVAAYYSQLAEHEDWVYHFLTFDETYQEITNSYLARRASEEWIQAKRYYKQNSHYQAAFHAGAMATYIARAASFPRLMPELDTARLWEYEFEMEKTIPAYSWINMESLRTSTVFQEYIEAQDGNQDPLASLHEAVEEMAGKIARGEDGTYSAIDMSNYLPMGADNSGGGVDVDDWTTPFKETVGASINDAVNLIARALHDIYRSPLDGEQDAPVFESLMSVSSTGESGEAKLTFWVAEEETTPLWYNIYITDVSGAYNFLKPRYVVREPIASLITHTITGLSDTTTYYFVVRAMDGNGNEDANSHELPVLVGTSSDRTAPSFTGLGRVRGTGLAGEVLLEWPAAIDISEPMTYLVFMIDETSSFDLNHARYSLTEKELLIQGLTDGIEYTFFVKVQDNIGNRDSNELKMKAVPNTSTDAVPPVFGGVTTAFATDDEGTAVLTWNEAVDESEPIVYNIFLSFEKGRLPEGFPDYTSYESPVQITGLENDKGIYAIVRAADNFGNEEKNTQELLIVPSVREETDPPEFFGLQSAEGSGQNGEVILSWYPAFDLSSPITYAVYQSSASLDYDFDQPVVTTQVFTTTISDLVDGQPYYFVVRAFDRFGAGESNVIERSAIPSTSGDTLPPVFSGLTSAEATGSSGEIRLRWPAGQDPSLPLTYRIYRSLVRGIYDFDTPTLAVQDTSVTIDGLTNWREYFFVVRAVDSAGNEDDNFREASATPVDNPDIVDSIPPIVLSSIPAAAAVDAPPTTPVRILFNEPLDPSSLEGNIIVLRGTSPVPGELQVEEDGSLIRFVPYAEGTLRFNTQYTVKVLKGLTDTSANNIEPQEWLFTTKRIDRQITNVYTFPNPVKGEDTITLHLILGAADGAGKITVRNMKGRVIKIQNSVFDTGPNLIEITLDDERGKRLIPGTYYVQLEYREPGNTLEGNTRMVVLR